MNRRCGHVGMGDRDYPPRWGTALASESAFASGEDLRALGARRDERDDNTRMRVCEDKPTSMGAPRGR
jgi:hypothetical protein